tara:strand:- start:4445 stop:4840 length:396 start_codon:yes stop_codon:yes gene_type:complete
MEYRKSNRNEVEKGTYGNSQCAIDLAQILTDLNDKGITRKVGTLLQGFNFGMVDLSHTQRMTETFYKMWLARYQSAIYNKKFPKDVESRVLNLITASYRKSKIILDAKNKGRVKRGTSYEVISGVSPKYKR